MITPMYIHTTVKYMHIFEKCRYVYLFEINSIALSFCHNFGFLRDNFLLLHTAMRFVQSVVLCSLSWITLVLTLKC